MDRRWLFGGLVAGAALVLAACGGGDVATGGDDDDSGTAAYSRDGERAVVPGVPVTGETKGAGGISTGTGDEPLAAETTRKVVFTATLALNSGDVGKSFNDASSLARSNGGYVEKSQYANNPDDNTRRSANMTIRVPVQNHEALLAALRTMSGVSVDTESSNATEVTEQYTDLQSRLRNLEHTEQQYLLLLNQAKTVQEILTVQDRLSGVRSQIEQIQGRLNVLDDLADFATVTVTVSPVVAKVQEPGDGWKLREVFAESWEGSLEAARYVAAGGIVLAVAAAWLAIPVTAAGFAAWRLRQRGRVARTLQESL